MKYLIVVDVQNDFVTGSLGTPEAEAVIPNIVKRIEEALKNDETVIATQDTHQRNYLDTQEGIKLPVKHCIINTEGHDIVEPVYDILLGCDSVYKDTFGSDALVDNLKFWYNKYSRIDIELIGLCTDICVIANAVLLKTAFPEARISVRENCCAGSTPEKHQAALKVMESLQIEVI